MLHYAYFVKRPFLGLSPRTPEGPGPRLGNSKEPWDQGATSGAFFLGGTCVSNSFWDPGEGPALHQHGGPSWPVELGAGVGGRP